MPCTECGSLKDITDLSQLYVIRTCRKCGRKIKLRTPGAHGIGLEVKKGDQFGFPDSFITLSANPLKGSGQFTPAGLSWFAEMVFGIDIAKKGNFPAAIRSLIDNNETILKDAQCLAGLDLNDPENNEEIFKRINANPKTIEWWSYMAAMFGSIALKAIEEANASDAAWAMATAERFKGSALWLSLRKTLKK